MRTTSNYAKQLRPGLGTKPGAQKHNLLFSDYFRIDAAVLSECGAFNISLVSDLPLFIDPFLLFHNEKAEYQALHREIIRYLDFLRQKSVHGEVTQGTLEAWYHFKEVKQTWLGFTRDGNGGSGLGLRFANELNRNFGHIFGDRSQRITHGKHLEKLCLIADRVGRDTISDFTTNLIKEYLLEFTQTFAKNHLEPSQCRMFAVSKVRFNYTTESWERGTYYLPCVRNDYVLLVPEDILTREETWINRGDLMAGFEKLPEAISDQALRAEVSNYIEKALTADLTDTKRREAKQKILLRFPDLVDYFILDKEEHGDEAVTSSSEKVVYAQSLFLERFTALAGLVAGETDFYQHDPTTFDGAVARVQRVRVAIEDKDGYQYLYDDRGRPVSTEDDLRIAVPFLWFNAPTTEEVDRLLEEKRLVPVDFKLARNKNLLKYLNKRHAEAKDVEASQATAPKPKVTAIFAFSAAEFQRAEEYTKGLNTDTYRTIVIDASKETQQRRKLEEYVQPQRRTTAFISYSHDRDDWRAKGEDPETQRERVFALAEWLRQDGVNCIIDQHIANPPEGWARWTMNQVEESDFVLVVATETYDRRFRGKEEPGKGHGAQWEGAIITQELYEANGRNEKFIPIIFERADAAHIPVPLKGATYYNVSDPNDLKDLYWRLTHQLYEPSPLGPVRQRPPRLP